MSARWLEWLWRGGAIRTARARLAASEASRSARERAQLSLALGGRAWEPSEPFAPGPDPAVACELFREASHWALVALRGGEPAAVGAAALWHAADRSLLLRAAAADETRLERIRAQLAQFSFVSYAELTAGERARVAAELRAFATALVEAASADELLLRRARRQRRWRVGVCLVLLGFGAFRASLLLRDGVDFRADLAQGKPWQSSSVALRCDPEARRCGDHFGMTIFFHTKVERSPWLVIDLESEQSVSGLRIRNRTDCCSDLAIPLVVELSSDQHSWSEVARRERNFRTWTPEFAPALARWVRLRVDRRSALHLERVSVYP